MKKLLVIGSVLASALFFGCDFFTPLDVQKSVPVENDDTTDPERKDVLALKHLQTVHIINEDTLASYVTDFLNVDAESGTGRSVQPAPAVVIT
jgi:hypothetical protein